MIFFNFSISSAVFVVVVVVVVDDDDDDDLFTIFMSSDRTKQYTSTSLTEVSLLFLGVSCSKHHQTNPGLGVNFISIVQPENRKCH